ncbi:MAG: adenylyl-sulfate kinase [Candidatus Scalindua sp.]
MENLHIVPFSIKINKENRQKLNRHGSAVLWFTGLSGSGKSTLASALDAELYRRNIHSYVLDGDNIRAGLNKNLSFTKEDRKENIRRIGEVVKLFVDAGIIVLTAFISPYARDRQRVRDIVASDEFIEIYVKCPLKECECRDVKGLYQKARNGEIKGFTGIDDPYEESENPEITIDTVTLTVKESVDNIIDYLESNRIIPS